MKRSLVNMSVTISVHCVLGFILSFLVGVNLGHHLDFTVEKVDFQTYTSPKQIYDDIGPSRVHKMEMSNCSYVSVGGYLKEKCIINNEEYFKCSNSDRFYQVTTGTTCRKSYFDRVCPNDTTFYQACGHNEYKCKSNVDSRPTKTKVEADELFGPDVAA